MKWDGSQNSFSQSAVAGRQNASLRLPIGPDAYRKSPFASGKYISAANAFIIGSHGSSRSRYRDLPKFDVDILLRCERLVPDEFVAIEPEHYHPGQPDRRSFAGLGPDLAPLVPCYFQRPAVGARFDQTRTFGSHIYFSVPQL